MCDKSCSTAKTTASSLYARPIDVTSRDNCFFYHFMDLPGEGQVGATWDLRDCVESYLGNLDYRGKRALDVGTASGYLTFEMEKRGAQVVSFDMPSVDHWDFVPHFYLKPRWQELVESRSGCHRQMQNAYWYTHRALNSQAQVHYGNVYDLPLELGNFDVVFMGMILCHLRDPFQALYSASRLASDTLIVTNPGRKPGWLSKLLRRQNYQAKFIPSKTNHNSDVWWALSSSCIKRMLETLGFQVVHEIESSAPCHLGDQVKKRKNLALVARRVSGEAEGLGDIAHQAAVENAQVSKIKAA